MARFFEDDRDDNSVDIDDSQFVNGDITRTTNSASGDGAVAAAQGATLTGVATGPGSQAAGDDLNNAEDGSAVIDGGNLDAFALNSPGAVQAGGGGDIGVANTGVANKSILADGDVSKSIAGDDNVQVQDLDDSAISFGKGSAFADIDAENSPFGNQGDVQQIQGNELGEGAALAGDDATTVSDDDVDVDAKDSNVNLATDDSDATATQADVDVEDSFNEDNDDLTQIREENTEIDDSFNKELDFDA